MFEKINEFDIDFDTISSVKDIPKEVARDFNNAVYDSVEACKAIVRNGKKDSVYASIDKEIKAQWLKDYIKSLLDKMMFGYNSLEPLREMEEEDVLSLVSFVNDIFDNCIIRYNIAFSGKFEEYKLETEEQLDNISLTFRSLARFYVINRYSTNSIISDFAEETGLSESVAKLVAETIEKNYNQLQMSVLLEQLINK